MTHSCSVHLNWLPLSSSSFFFTPRDLGTSFVQEGSELYLSLSRKSYLDSFRYLSGISELEDHLLGVAQALKQTRQLPIRERERGEEGARGREGERFECVRERDGKERERARASKHEREGEGKNSQSRSCPPHPHASLSLNFYFPPPPSVSLVHTPLPGRWGSSCRLKSS